MNNCLILNHNIRIYMTTAIGSIGIILCTPIDNSKWFPLPEYNSLSC